MLLKLLVKDKPLYGRKVLVSARMANETSEERETRPSRNRNRWKVTADERQTGN